MSCGSKIGTFDCCSVVEGNCLEVVNEVSGAGRVQALISDPPYGINLNTNYATAKRNCRRDFPRIVGDDRPFDPAPFLGFPIVVLFGANHFASRLPDSSGWIVWFKRYDARDRNDQADCELAWTNRKFPARVIHHVWNGFVRQSERDVVREHPTQKPVAVMQQIIEMLTEPGAVVFDPFLGSGTTAVAAKRAGRHFLGVEISPEYCAIARRRVAETEAQPALIVAPEPEQGSLL